MNLNYLDLCIVTESVTLLESTGPNAGEDVCESAKASDTPIVGQYHKVKIVVEIFHINDHFNFNSFLII